MFIVHCQTTEVPLSKNLVCVQQTWHMALRCSFHPGKTQQPAVKDITTSSVSICCFDGNGCVECLSLLHFMQMVAARLASSSLWLMWLASWARAPCTLPRHSSR